MSDTEQADCDVGVSGSAGNELPPPVLSHRDYALYVEDMSAELARIADRAGLQTVIGHSLRMASLACREAAKGGSGEPRCGKATD